jgi:hypothetical protein
MPNQIAASILRYPFDDFRLCHPGERIAYVKGVTENPGKHPTEARQRLRVRGASCPGADDLGNRRQVQTHNAVLEKENALSVK